MRGGASFEGLLGSFHQDWSEDHASWEEVVDLYVQDCDADARKFVAGEIASWREASRKATCIETYLAGTLAGDKATHTM